MLITFLTLGRMLECKAKGRTSQVRLYLSKRHAGGVLHQNRTAQALEKLMGMQSRTAILLSAASSSSATPRETEIPVELVQIGDVCKVCI